MTAAHRAAPERSFFDDLDLDRPEDEEEWERRVMAMENCGIPSGSMTVALADSLVGSWELLSRVDRTGTGEERVEPSLGSDPVAFLMFDRAGHFAAQFMKRDRSARLDAPASSSVSNNSRAQGGYDAYFGTYAVEPDGRTVSTRLVGALSPENVGQVFRRRMFVEAGILTIELDTTTSTGEPVTRTLRWKRVA